MRPGDILLVRTATLWGWLIRLVTRSEWSHVALYIGDGMIAEIDAFQGAHVSPLAYDRYQVLRHPAMTEEQAAVAVAWCRGQVGAMYDWGVIVEIGLRIVYGLHACIDSGRRYICTELVLEAYRAADIDLAPGCDALTPGEFSELPGLEPVEELQTAV